MLRREDGGMQKVAALQLTAIHWALRKGRTQTQGVWERGAEENVWTQERGSDRRVEATAQ